MSKIFKIAYLFFFVLFSCSKDLENLPTYSLSLLINGEGNVIQETVSEVSSSNYEEVRLSAEPLQNWTFTEWGGDLETTENPVLISLDVPKNITANFIRNFDYNQPSYFFKNSDLWLDLNEISGLDNVHNTGSAIADFNNDGYNDIFLAGSGNASNERDPVEILLNDGDNNFTWSNLINNNTGTDAARKSIVGDYNLDGKPDVFMADHGHEDLESSIFYFAHPSIMLSNEEGTYDFNILENLPLDFYHGATSGDFDNDGDLDIFCSTKLMLINDGNGVFSQNTSLFQEETDNIYTVEFFDFNKDGFLDLICGGHSMTEGHIPSSKIYYGNGIDFTSERSILLPNLPEWEVTVDYGIADLNNDGDEEIILVRTGGYVNENDEMINFYNGWRIQVLEKISDDEYTDNTSGFMNDFYGDSQWIVRIRIQDFDNDGRLEIFENDRSNYQSNNPRIWIQNSNNFFERN